MAKSDIDQQVISLDLYNMDINQKRFQADYLYNKNIFILKYDINRKNLKDYIEKIFGCRPNDNRLDSNDSIEKNDFKFFIASQEGICLNYDNCLDSD